MTHTDQAIQPEYDCTASRLEDLFNDMTANPVAFTPQVSVDRWAWQVSQAIKELRGFDAWTV